MNLWSYIRKPSVVKPQRRESVQLFVKEPTSCANCHRVNLDTFTFHTCHHTVCSNCTYKMYKQELNLCPICKTELREKDYQRFKKQCQEKLLS